MAVDKIQGNEFWTGTEANDAVSYLEMRYRDEAKRKDMALADIHLVKCNHCNAETMAIQAQLDMHMSEIKATCSECFTEHFLTDGEGVWNKGHPQKEICSSCNNDKFNVAMGYVYDADDGTIDWVCVGRRCIGCGMLSDYGYWEINWFTKKLL